MTKHDMQARSAVQTLAAQGKTRAEIAALLKKSWTFVDRWYGRSEVARLRAGGGPTLLTVDKRASISKKLQRKRKSTSLRKVAAEIGLSKTTVGRAADQAGLKPYHPQRRPAISQQQARKRLEFARAHKNDDWSRTLFVDEKTFTIGGGRNRKNEVVWSTSAESVPNILTVKHPLKIHACGGISAQGITEIHLFTENLTASKFVEILDSTIVHGGNELMEEGQWRLAMDSDPKHTAQTTTCYLENSEVEYISKAEWPANSPDLNPIENIWSHLDSQLQTDPPKNLQQLKTRIRKLWAEMDKTFLEKCIFSMQRRLRAVIKARGHATDY